MELLSIVIPIYNVDKYLKACLKSVQNQTYKEIQVILVDDGSTDKSAEICAWFVKHDKRFEYHFKENGGLSDARNYGMKLAQGKYIGFLDSDDMITSDYFSVLYNNIKRTSADISIISYQYIDEEGKAIFYKKWKEKRSIKIIDQDAALYHMYSKKHNIDFVTAWGKLYRIELFKDIQYPVSRRNEDEFTTYKLFLKADKIVYQNYQGYLYRIRPGSIMNTSFSEKNLDILDALKERLTLFSKKSKRLKVITQYAYCLQLINIIKQMKQNRYDDSKIKYLKKELQDYYDLKKFLLYRVNVMKILKIIYLKNKYR